MFFNQHASALRACSYSSAQRHHNLNIHVSALRACSYSSAPRRQKQMHAAYQPQTQNQQTN
jgi:hypothetical protein